MRGKLSTFLLVLASAGIIAAGAHPAFAESRWSTTSGGTFDWNNSGNWQGTFPPGPADDVRITNDLGSAQLITNMGGSSAIGATNTINFLSVSNGLGSASVTVQQAPGVSWKTSFGFQIGQNATLIIDTNAIIGTNSSVTFNLRPAGLPGTLILSNASSSSGFSSFVNSGGSAAINNAGTIAFTPTGNQLVSINYGQTGAFTNAVNGTVVMNGSGTGAFIGNFSTSNSRFANSGSIFVQAGTFRVDPRQAFSGGGFQNLSTGYIQINTNAAFEIRRTTNAWVAATPVTNAGTVFMNGGSFVAADYSDQTGTNFLGPNAARTIVNVGTFRGNGSVIASISNLSGSFLAPGLGFQTLNVGGSVTLGSNSTFSVELGLLAGQEDLLNVASNLTLNANSILELTGGAVGNIYTVAVASVVSGTFGSVTPDYTVTYGANDIAVQFIPEPSTMLLVITGLGGIVALRRRRR